MMRRPATWLDVFTSTQLSGNQLAVVHDADDLTDATMLAFTREMRLSESSFVQTPTRPGADYRNRIWTSLGEIPFAGHPSLGTAVAVARLRGESSASYVQQTHAGNQPIEVSLDGDLAHASMLQEPPRFGREASLAHVMPAIGLKRSDADPDLPPQVVWTGIGPLVVPLRDRETLARIKLDPPKVAALLEALNAPVLYTVVVEPGCDMAWARGFFFGVRGIVEDPATGSAAGPLLAYMNKRAATVSLVVSQGEEIDRPSRIDCSWADDRPCVAGDVVVVIEGHVYV
jgi:trans-2,3-dihydro-3-hydroxyanthranilate isomerase